MTTPKIKIKQINKTSFLFTFWIDGKRSKRQTFYGTKREAELTASHYQSEMLANKYDFLEQKQIISLPGFEKNFTRLCGRSQGKKWRRGGILAKNHGKTRVSW